MKFLPITLLSLAAAAALSGDTTRNPTPIVQPDSALQAVAKTQATSGAGPGYVQCQGGVCRVYSTGLRPESRLHTPGVRVFRAVRQRERFRPLRRLFRR